MVTTKKIVMEHIQEEMIKEFIKKSMIKEFTKKSTRHKKKAVIQGPKKATRCREVSPHQ
jgi:tRNA A-37 threonylcarbamoyl transferase component Bud32